jgi:crotonobetainyl-CoA:carnitine CoA-transferase CaiB-like acyl-CoA transferase
VLEALPAPWFAERTFSEVTAGLEGAKVLWGPYRTVENLVSDPPSAMNRSQLMAEVHHDGVGTFPCRDQSSPSADGTIPARHRRQRLATTPTTFCHLGLTCPTPSCQTSRAEV